MFIREAYLILTVITIFTRLRVLKKGPLTRFTQGNILVPWPSWKFTESSFLLFRLDPNFSNDFSHQATEEVVSIEWPQNLDPGHGGLPQRSVSLEWLGQAAIGYSWRLSCAVAQQLCIITYHRIMCAGSAGCHLACSHLKTDKSFKKLLELISETL